MNCIEIINSIKKFAQKACGKRFNKNGKESSLRDTIEELIEEDECSATQSIAEDERELLGNILNLRNIHVQNIMVPRVEIVAVPITTKIEDLMSLFVETQKSSILVYQGTIDNMVGAVYLKDVANWFHMNKPFNINIFVKEILFVPPTMRTLDLILKMRETGIKLAAVVDEYGDVDGIVSFRDLIEEIIGDIQDVAEVRNQKRKVIKGSDGSVVADAKATFEEINKYGGIKLSTDDKTIETVGGMVFSISGKVPVRGELISCPKQNIEFEILDADPRKVKSVRIRRRV